MRYRTDETALLGRGRTGFMPPPSANAAAHAAALSGDLVAGCASVAAGDVVERLQSSSQVMPPFPADVMALGGGKYRPPRLRVLQQEGPATPGHFGPSRQAGSMPRGRHIAGSRDQAQRATE